MDHLAPLLGIKLHPAFSQFGRVVVEAVNPHRFVSEGPMPIGRAPRLHTRNLKSNYTSPFALSENRKHPSDGPNETRLGPLPVHALRKAETGDGVWQNLR